MANTKKAIEEVTEKEIPRAAYEGVLTIDVDAQVESAQEQEDTRWHQLLNAHRTRKVLTGQLGGIEKLESGWMVAVTYYNGFRIIIPMNEMMINLSGDGRENADTLNRQVRIANNMLGCDIDFIIKDLDTKSRSVVASRKDAMLKKRQTFYIGEEGEKPLLYPGRIAEARVIAVAPKAVRLEVFGVEVSVRARDMAWEWMLDAGEKFQVGHIEVEDEAEEILEETEEEEFHFVRAEDENPFADDEEEGTDDESGMESEEEELERARKVMCNFGLFSGKTLGEMMKNPKGADTVRWMATGYYGSNMEMVNAAKIIVAHEKQKKLAA